VLIGNTKRISISDTFLLVQVDECSVVKGALPFTIFRLVDLRMSVRSCSNGLFLSITQFSKSIVIMMPIRKKSPMPVRIGVAWDGV
jgi:hypothetical protein